MLRSTNNYFLLGKILQLNIETMLVWMALDVLSHWTGQDFSKYEMYLQKVIHDISMYWNSDCGTLICAQ